MSRKVLFMTRIARIIIYCIMPIYEYSVQPIANSIIGKILKKLMPNMTFL